MSCSIPLRVFPECSAEGSRGPGGDQKSLRLCSQASASVRECRAFWGVENRRETQIRHDFLRLAFQKRQQSQGSGGSWSRNAELSLLLDLLWVFASQKRNSHRDQGGRGRETQNCRRFGTGVGSSRLRSANRHGDRAGSWSRNEELSSFLDLCRVFASQKCQQSQGSGGSALRNAELSHFWTGVESSRLKSVNSHRDHGGRGREMQNCFTCLRREERRNERGQKRKERREETGEERGENRRGGSRKRRGERRGEEREERREGEKREGGEDRGERREERREREERIEEEREEKGRRGERREDRSEKEERRGQSRKERGEDKGEKREERRKRRGESGKVKGEQKGRRRGEERGEEKGEK